MESPIIDKFKGSYFFLSNYCPAQVEYEGSVYPSVEHAYQAAKTLDLRQRSRILMAGTAGKAKDLGYKVDLRPDWEAIKIQVMRDCLRSKFTRSWILRDALLATGSAELIEGNWWKDTFWGVCDGEGQNWLGRLLMEIREELRNGTTGGSSAPVREQGTTATSSGAPGVLDQPSTS